MCVRGTAHKCDIHLSSSDDDEDDDDDDGAFSEVLLPVILGAFLLPKRAFNGHKNLRFT